jgi:hypothetical protein
MSKYFPKFCMCTLLFSAFSYKPLLYSRLTIYHALFPYNPVDIFPIQHTVLLPSVAISLLITTLFHFLFSNSILCTTFYPRKSSILCTVLNCFSENFTITSTNFIHYTYYITYLLCLNILKNVFQHNWFPL